MRLKTGSRPAHTDNQFFVLFFVVLLLLFPSTLLTAQSLVCLSLYHSCMHVCVYVCVFLISFFFFFLFFFFFFFFFCFFCFSVFVFSDAQQRSQSATREKGAASPPYLCFVFVYVSSFFFFFFLFPLSFFCYTILDSIVVVVCWCSFLFWPSESSLIGYHLKAHSYDICLTFDLHSPTSDFDEDFDDDVIIPKTRNGSEPRFIDLVSLLSFHLYNMCCLFVCHWICKRSNQTQEVKQTNAITTTKAEEKGVLPSCSDSLSLSLSLSVCVCLFHLFSFPDCCCYLLAYIVMLEQAATSSSRRVPSPIVKTKRTRAVSSSSRSSESPRTTPQSKPPHKVLFCLFCFCLFVCLLLVIIIITRREEDVAACSSMTIYARR